VTPMRKTRGGNGASLPGKVDVRRDTAGGKEQEQNSAVHTEKIAGVFRAYNRGGASADGEYAR